MSLVKKSPQCWQVTLFKRASAQLVVFVEAVHEEDAIDSAKQVAKKSRLDDWQLQVARQERRQRGFHLFDGA